MVNVKEWKKNGTEGWEVDIRITLPDGSRHRERVKSPVSSKSGTLRWAQQREAEIIAQGGRKAEESKAQEPVPTLDKFWPRFMKEHMAADRRKPSSIAAAESVYRYHLAPRLGAKALDQITDADVASLKADLAHVSGSTVNNVLTALGSALKRAVEWGVLERPPCRVRLLKTCKPEVAFYDFGEYRRLVDAATAIDPRIELLVLLGGDAGLRRGEFLGLEWADLDFKRGVMLVQRSEWSGHVTVPKGGRGRRVPMTERLAAALQAHRHLRGARVLYDDATVPTVPTPKVVRMWMERAQRRAGLPLTGGVHILRHSFCSHLAMQGAPAKAIQELAGHANLTTTMRYMHLSPGAKDAAIRLLDHRPTTDEVRGELGETKAPACAGVSVIQ
jgi:integrase